jgi:hypothetical protein
MEQGSTGGRGKGRGERVAGRQRSIITKICEWCGKEFVQRHQKVGTAHFYDSAKCRALAYQGEHQFGDWLLLKILGKAYSVIQEGGLNFELEVPRSAYPGSKAARAEYRQFLGWAQRFAVDDRNGPAAEPVMSADPEKVEEQDRQRLRKRLRTNRKREIAAQNAQSDGGTA